jgi:hypothetical protein
MVAVVVILCGVLFGYDQGVIAGAGRDSEPWPEHRDAGGGDQPVTLKAPWVALLGGSLAEVPGAHAGHRWRAVCWERPRIGG